MANGKWKRRKNLNNGVTVAGNETYGDVNVEGFAGAISDRELAIAQELAMADEVMAQDMPGVISDREREAAIAQGLVGGRGALAPMKGRLSERELLMAMQQAGIDR